MWWDLLFGRSEECDARAHAVLKATKYDAALEYDECEEVTFKLEGLTPF